MLKRELKINLKSLLIWTIVILFIFLAVYLVYPSIMNSENSQMINQMMETFPEELLKSFNMDITSIDKVLGWFKTEGYTIYVLLVSIYSGILGSTILLKEESDKTIEELNSVPVNRNRIVSSKIIVGFINIITIVIIFTIFNVIGMSLSHNLEFVPLLLLSICPLFVFLSVFSICLFISTFFKKSKNVLGISIFIVFISYIIQIISGIGTNLDFMKYFSLFTLSDSRYIINNSSINILSIVCTIIIIGISLFGTYYNYNRKEFY